MTASSPETYDFPLSDLVIGEVPRWDVGVCEIYGAERRDNGTLRPVRGGMRTMPDVIVVSGERGPCGVWDADTDRDALRAKIDSAIRREMNAL